MKIKKIYLLVFLITFFFSANSQTIIGTIVDKNNSPLIGVNVYSKSGKGVTTNFNGAFKLDLEEGLSKISFSYIGYETLTKEYSLEINKTKNIKIVLNEVSKKLDVVVISAGKFEQRIEETTVSMEVIKPQMIENKNTTEIQTAMEQIPGVNITDGQANIRGGSGWSYGAGSRVLVMVDDMPLISGDAGQVQWKLIATENINQVEVIKGASSVLYGSSALNGVINIRTAFPSRKDIEKNPSIGYTKINSHYGFIDFPQRSSLIWWNQYKRRVYKGLEFFHAQKLENINITLGGNVFKDQGYRKGEVTDRKRFNFSLEKKDEKIKNLIYGIKGNFLFQSTGSALIWDSYKNGYVSLDDKITTTSGDVFNIDPYVKYKIGNNRHSLNTRYLHLINDNETKGSESNDDNRSRLFYTDYQWQQRFEKINLMITSGTTNEIVFAQSKIFQGKNSRSNHSLYSQIDKKFGKLNISVGARYEYFSLDSEDGHEIDGDTIYHFAEAKPVLRGGLNYQIGAGTFIRSSWGQGYRFPSMAELFVTTNVSDIEIFPNPTLKSEKGWSSELGIKQAFKIGGFKSFFDIAAFVMRYDDMMEFTFGQWGEPEFDENGNTSNFFGLGFKSVNVGKTQISGIELSISGQGKINNLTKINFIGGYTYMNPISLKPNKSYANDFYGNPITYKNSSSDSTILKYRYKNVAKLDVELNRDKFSIGSSVRYNDFMSNIDYIFTTEIINNGDPNFGVDALIPGINESREKFKNGDIIFDMRIGYQIDEMSKIGFVVNNLFNREYMSRPANMMPPRTFAFLLNLKV
tara:strand:- start:2 stop:2410 length:2409 start_codon:yes stop_codon:yes gene_type:complete